MTAPLRRALLNEEIALEARAIAHEWTSTCNRFGGEDDSSDDAHTANCNALKRRIEALAMSVKLATLQPKVRTSQQDNGPGASKGRDPRPTTAPAAAEG